MVDRRWSGSFDSNPLIATNEEFCEPAHVFKNQGVWLGAKSVNRLVRVRQCFLSKARDNDPSRRRRMPPRTLAGATLTLSGKPFSQLPRTGWRGPSLARVASVYCRASCEARSAGFEGNDRCCLLARISHETRLDWSMPKWLTEAVREVKYMPWKQIAGWAAAAVAAWAVLDVSIRHSAFGAALVGTGTLMLAAAAFGQMMSLRDERRYARTAQLDLKNVDFEVTEVDGQSRAKLKFRMLANLGQYPLLIRYCGVCDEKKSVYLDSFRPNIMLKSGDMLLDEAVSLLDRKERDRENRQNVDGYSPKPPKPKKPDKWLPEAKWLHFVYRSGSRLGRDVHVWMPKSGGLGREDTVVFLHWKRRDREYRANRFRRDVPKDEEAE